MGRLVPNFGEGGSVGILVILVEVLFFYFAGRGGYQLLRMYVCWIPVKLDRNAF